MALVESRHARKNSTTPVKHGAASKRRHAPSNRRSDIQGLRAVAVIVVILNHLVGWPNGGFVGVDVFFVISGFLITGLLYREHERTGRISFTNFYRRRIRRIVPLATAVLLVTVVGSYLLYLPSRAALVGIDAIWAFFFSINWHLAAVGTNYWANDTGVSPLQHYWSLAVEEQFYVLWPWLLLAVLGLGLKLRWSEHRRRAGLLILMGLVTGASFLWATAETAAQPTWAYFSTLSRGWELGVGAIIAVSASTWAKLPDKSRPYIAWVGLAGIGASLFLVSEARAFPAPWAVLPVASTALVVIAGTAGRQRTLTPLTNRVSVYVGDISYSLYLWHFPVLILLGAILPVGPLYYAAAFIAVVSISIFSYHAIEEPFRAPSGPAAHKSVHSRAKPWLHRLLRRAAAPSKQQQVAVTALLLSITVVLVAVAIEPRLGATPSSAVPPVATIPVSTPAKGAKPQSAAMVRQSAAISAALSARRFPALSPSVDDLGIDKWLEEIGEDDCATITAARADSCELGEGEGKEVVVLGDSYALAWLPGIKKAFPRSAWKVSALAMGECPAMSVTVTQGGGGAYPECNAHRKWALNEVQRIRPYLVIIADTDNTLYRLQSEAAGASAQSELKDGLAATLTAVEPYAKKTVVLAPPPSGASLQDCATRVSRPFDCARKISGDWLTLAKSMTTSSKAGGAAYIDTRAWFCDSRNWCPAFVEDKPVRVDASHISIQYAESLSPLIKEAISKV